MEDDNDDDSEEVEDDNDDDFEDDWCWGTVTYGSSTIVEQPPNPSIAHYYLNCCV